MRLPLAARFWPKVYKHADAGCWEWLGARSSSGYGHIGSGGTEGRMLRAHRVSWELINGPIPAGLQVLHNCPDGDNPLCVRPEHLWLGTHQDNMADKWRKGRGTLSGQAACAAFHRNKTQCPHGHAYAGDNLRLTRDGSRRCRACDAEGHRARRAAALRRA
ncbi:MAG: HNH endonuclease signature motif containing protein [Chloroflexota bacterium]